MKICTRCSGKLDTVAKAARSEVCSTCGATSGDCATLVLLPMFKLRRGEREDWHRLIDRMH